MADIESKIISRSFIREAKKVNLESIRDLLYFFYVRSMASNIMMTLNVQNDIARIEIAESDLIKILLHQLGNAFMDAKQSEKKIININFSQNKNYTGIIIENSMQENFINRISRETDSTICDEIARKYSNIERKVSIDSYMQTQELQIKF